MPRSSTIARTARTSLARSKCRRRFRRFASLSYRLQRVDLTIQGFVNTIPLAEGWILTMVTAGPQLADFTLQAQFTAARPFEGVQAPWNPRTIVSVSQEDPTQPAVMALKTSTSGCGTSAATVRIRRTRPAGLHPAAGADSIYLATRTFEEAAADLRDVLLSSSTTRTCIRLFSRSLTSISRRRPSPGSTCRR